MRPIAAPLLAIRAGISLLGFGFILVHRPFGSAGPQPRVISPTLFLAALYAFGLGIVALNTIVAWYAYKVTARQTDSSATPGSFRQVA